MAFPTNPSNNDIYEAKPRVFYKYSAVTKTWNRISNPVVPVVTEFENGLMSSSDYTKLIGMIIPPPQSTLSIQGCDTTYSEGFIDITGDGIVNVEVKSDNLHENTGIIDFTLDTGKLVTKLTELGKYILTVEDGDQGEQGEQGDPGLDALPIGPYGKDGAPGANAPWPGSLIEDNIEILDDNKVVVSIEVDKVSEDENYLVVTRAYAGNPNACPNQIIPTNIQSPWMMAISASAPTSSTSTGKGSCSYSCNSEIYYFNIESIVKSIRNQYVTYLNSVKATKEAEVNEWLESLITIFEDQKASLCCALESCRSKYRNEDARRYVENARIVAHQNNARVMIGTPDDWVVPTFFNDQKCTYEVLRMLDQNVSIE